MANRKFTEQEMLTLRNSKYVLDVSPSIVHFSAEFKKLFWEELSKGRLPREIISTFGIQRVTAVGKPIPLSIFIGELGIKNITQNLKKIRFYMIMRAISHIKT